MTELKLGDITTIEGRYKRRTFWQWLTRKPRQLEQFMCVASVSADHEGETIEIKKPNRYVPLAADELERWIKDIESENHAV